MWISMVFMSAATTWPSPASPACGMLVMIGSASRISSVSSVERKAILMADFRNSTRFFLEKMFLRLDSTLSFLAEGLSFSNANSTPTCRASAKIPAPSTMPMKGSTIHAASLSSSWTNVFAASLKPSRSSVPGSRIIWPSVSTMWPALASR